MNPKYFHLLLVIYFISLISCKKEKPLCKKDNKIINNITDCTKTSKNNIDSTYIITKTSKTQNQYNFIDRYPIRKPPIIDSTNFYSVKNNNLLKRKQIELLHLKNVIPSNILEHNNKIYINYLLDLSDNFKTIIFYYYSGENELFTILVNYTLNYEVIDWKIIAYDETAENWFRTQSFISQNKIKVENISYIETNPEIKVENYSIMKNGKIIKK
ncbi:hypothetical protein C4S77_06480 [Apibacter adventoris]|uniref:Uncharacterized protein n=1 Tax=Apibacter adventoris TaxID=1679466 RepID=A0A2S8ACG7_9FLAO|nr:hypothetical protein C4S77_06480 [Apibacter adventoris]